MKNNKLSIEQRMQLVMDYNNGASVSALQAKYEVARATITWHVQHCAGIQPRKVGRPKLSENRHAYLDITARRYGITVEELIQRYRRSRGKCKICKDKIRLRNHTRRATACYDHNHDNGAFRGFLCYRCNLALGELKDSVKLLLRAAQYVAMDGKMD